MDARVFFHNSSKISKLTCRITALWPDALSQHGYFPNEYLIIELSCDELRLLITIAAAAVAAVVAFDYHMSYLVIRIAIDRSARNKLMNGCSPIADKVAFKKSVTNCSRRKDPYHRYRRRHRLHKVERRRSLLTQLQPLCQSVASHSVAFLRYQGAASTVSVHVCYFIAHHVLG